jgi:hypothetical protein
MERVPLITAVRELVIVGERAGFSIEEMVELLNAGVSLKCLLELIAERINADLETGTGPLGRSRWVM